MPLCLQNTHPHEQHKFKLPRLDIMTTSLFIYSFIHSWCTDHLCTDTTSSDYVALINMIISDQLEGMQSNGR
jgi:hypothetical protein